jgi:hypothetical protein
LRSTCIAAVFGVGAVADAYNYAYIIPGFLLVLLGGINGPLHSALVSVLAKRDKSAAAPLVETITTLVSGVLLLVTIGVRLDLDNEPQPAAVLMIEEQAGGQAQLSEDDYIEGAPELVAEIAASSAAIDLGDKKRAYRRNGINEYIVWQVFEQRLDWFRMQEGEYVPLPVDEDGVIRSQVFPGLWLAVNDLLSGNMGRVLAVLQEGLAAPEHTVFVQQLSE